MRAVGAKGALDGKMSTVQSSTLRWEERAPPQQARGPSPRALKGASHAGFSLHEGDLKPSRFPSTHPTPTSNSTSGGRGGNSAYC